MNLLLAVSGHDATRRMVSVGRLNCDWREARRLRTPLLQLLLPLMFAMLLSNARAQQPGQPSRSCATDSASTLCCTSSSCDDGSKESVQLARVVSALRESEARTAQLRLDLTAALVTVAHSSELAAGAAQNACDAHSLEFRASSDAADRLAANVSHEFRRAAEEREALRRRANDTDERMRTQDADLRTLEQALNETRLELNASTNNVAKAKKEMESNLSAISDALYYAIHFANERINASENQILELVAIAAQQDTKIGYLNRAQQQSEVSWKHQALALSIELNSTKLVLEQIREELGRLKKENEGLINDAQNMSAMLKGCPSGWRRHGSWCYFLVDFRYNWSESGGRCKLLNADLVAFITPDVNAFLSAYMNTSGTYTAWLGGTDAESEGTWKWTTGEIFYPSWNEQRSYTNFGYRQPDNNIVYNWRDPQNCLTIVGGGSWYDEQCYSLYNFFCRLYKP